ncbi:MAG: hypothetical protein HY216_07865 [Candidatus Rokubacteria bacterium]|nr:hypothetical protein [Candidatus Rokubacteria bacterium]
MRTVSVPATADVALLQLAAVLRAFGARITRYDADALTLEARLSRWGRPAMVTARAEEGNDAARIGIETDAIAGGWLLRRVERSLYTTLSRRSAAISSGE